MPGLIDAHCHSISGVLGDHCLVSQIFPGPTPDVTTTRQTARDEDCPVGLALQAGINPGANKAFIFGRNEPAVQNYRRTIAHLMQDAGAAWRA